MRLVASLLAAIATVHVSGPSPFAHCSGPSFVGSEVEPSLAADPKHPPRLYAVWQQDRNVRAGARGIVVARSADGGRTWSEPRVILPHGDRAGPLSSVLLFDRRQGRMYDVASWVRNGAPTNEQPPHFIVQHSDDGGETWRGRNDFAIGLPARSNG